MLGGMEGEEYIGPQNSRLPKVFRSTNPREFTLGGLAVLGIKLSAGPSGLLLAEESGGREYIRFDDQTDTTIKKHTL